MSKFILGVLALAAIGSYMLYSQKSSNSYEEQFISFIQEHRKSYFSKEEYNFRLSQFTLNLKEIEELNANPEDFAEYGVNHFADWTLTERSNLLGLKVPFPEDQKNTPYYDAPRRLSDEREQDWRQKGKMSAVKDQASCGSCWAFAATETIEARWSIEHGPVFDLSEQEYVDCSSPQNNQGCNGGWYFWAWDYHLAKKGLASENEYVYTGRDDACKANYNVRHSPITSYNRIRNTEEDFKNILLSEPVAVAVDASNWSFYKGGVFSNCGNRINHAVLAVGFNKDDQWILRNSWGTKWGADGGFIYLAKGNTCAVWDYIYKVNVPK